jgi:hypothetical protein
MEKRIHIFPTKTVPLNLLFFVGLENRLQSVRATLCTVRTVRYVLGPTDRKYHIFIMCIELYLDECEV